jgi:hypothetical protein
VLVRTSRAAPWIVPASIFTTHPDAQAITKALASCGIGEISVNYGQMYSLKQAINHVARLDSSLAARIVQLDTELANVLVSRLTVREAARLFPTVVVRGVKS